MAASWAQKFYGSAQWKKCRSGFLAYKRGLCERCLAKGLIVAGYHVHHKIYLTPENITDPAVSLNWNNLELLCDKCHEEEHSRHHSKGRMTINKDGTVTGREVDTR
jgi:5-methylcytosine-specific restriction endonuclease McrA